MDVSNLAHASLIIASLYFGYTYGFTWWIFLLVIYALATWKLAGTVKKEWKDLTKAQTEYYEAKAEYFRRRKA